MFKIIYTTFVLFSLLCSSHAQAQSLSVTRITLHLKNSTLKQFIQSVEAMTSYKFLAKAEDLEITSLVSIDAANEPLNVVLDKVFTPLRLRYSVTGNNILIKKQAEDQNIQHAPTESATVKEKYYVHGTIKHASNGEIVIGASVSISGSASGTVSNEYGFYSLAVPRGELVLEISSVGSKLKQFNLNVVQNLKLDVALEDDTADLQVITVTTSATERNLRNPRMGMEKINLNEVKTIPVLFGERDILKTMQLLPGIKSARDGASGFYTRGGSTDQNLILLDEAPVYNPSHLLGFFSTFNSDAIKNVTLYKGTMPAQYGGRLSSVIDVRMNEGNNQHFGVSGGIGLIASRINIEGPIQKNRSSFLISGRRTYADLFLKLGDSSFKNVKLYFYDLNVKTNFIAGEKDRIFLSGYFGRDVLKQDRSTGIDWGNITATLRWNHIFNKNLFSNTSAIFSNYDYKINVSSGGNSYGILSRIRDYNLKEELQWYINSSHTAIIGINPIYRVIKPGEISSTGSNSQSPGLSERYSLDNALYATDQWRVNTNFSIDYGIRLSLFTILGKGDFYTLDQSGKVVDTLHYGPGEIVKTYVNAEPRLSASYSINSTTSVKVSYTRNSQNLHLIPNTTSTSPTDKWVASTNIIKPEVAGQFAIGYYKSLNNGTYELSAETYYKRMTQQIDYRNGARVFTNDAIESQLLFGKGRAYGIELLLKKKKERLTGWISYTLSKTERQVDGINDGRWYNAKQDRTHDIAIVAMYQLNKKWTVSANWVFYTGDAVTYPAGKYTVDNNVYYYYTERNSYRMPNYHRLDIGATKQLKKGKRFSSELNISIYNVYGRANAYQIDFRKSETDPDKTEAVRTSLFTFVPSISYNFKF